MIIRHLKAYLFIKKNRLQRKKRTYALALQVIMDRTTAIYLSVLGGYLLLSFFIVGDFIENYEQQFLFIEEMMRESMTLVLTIMPIIYVFRSFRNPGVIFSRAEQKLSVLPFSRKNIWLFSFFEKWVSQMIIVTSIGLLVALVAPFSLSTIFAYVGIIGGSHLLLPLPQWRLFQKNWLIKAMFLLVTLTIHLLNSFYPQDIFIVIISLLISLLLLNSYFLQQTLFRGVQWNDVIEISDFHVWNMPIVSTVSKVKMKKPRGISVFQRLIWRRRPFRYKDQPIYHRLWQLYFGKNFTLVFRSVGALFLILAIFAFLDDLYFHIILAVSIYIYAVIAKNFFLSRFSFDVIEALPWDLVGYKRAFVSWAFFGGFILLFPVGLSLGMNQSIWLPFQLLFYSGTFVCLLHVQIDQAICTLQNKIIMTDRQAVIAYVALGCIVISWFFPYVLLLGLLFPFYLQNKGSER